MGIHNGNGITALQSAVILGKIVVMTDLDGHVHHDLLRNGSTGFLVGLEDVNGWKRVMQHLMSCTAAQLRTYMNGAFDMAESFSREQLVKKFTDRYALLPK